MKIESPNGRGKEDRNMSSPEMKSSSTESWREQIVEQIPHSSEWKEKVEEAESKALHPPKDDGGMW